MKRSGWILLGSVSTLLLCAAPYGCSGKYVDSPDARGDGNGTFIPPSGDGIARTEGTGYATDGAQLYGGERREGTFVISDGAYNGGDGIPYITEGSQGDGGYIPIQGDGADQYYGDGTSVDYPEGSPNNADGDSTTPEGYADGYGG